MDHTKNGHHVLLGPNGQPYRQEPPPARYWEDRRRDPSPFLGDGMPIPHVISFGSLLSGANHTYWHARFDEAMKHSRSDALVMENDCYLMGLLQERKLAVASLPWHIDVPNEKDPVQQKVQKVLTEQIEQIPGLQRIFMSLLEALWFGRYAIQEKWDWERKQGLKCLYLKKWKPINGDKIGHQHDDTPYIMGHAAYLRRIPGAELIITQGGSLAMRLNPAWRDRFVIHKHEIYDANFLDAEKGEAIHGLGIRSRIFWMNWLKLEYMGAIVDFMERVGLGVTLWYFDASNPKAKEEAASAAKEQSDRTNLLVPYWPSERDSKSIERIETPANGAELLLKLQEQIDKYIERYIVGQEMSSSANSSGMGNEAAAEFQQATKGQIVKYDAGNLAETLTGSEEEPGIVWMLQKHTFPETIPSDENPNGFRARLVFNVEGSRPEKELEAAHKLWSMNLSLKSDQVRSRAGYSKPEEGDEVLKGQADQQAEQQMQQMQAQQAQAMPEPGAEQPGQEQPQLEEPEQESEAGSLDDLVSIMEQMQRGDNPLHYQAEPDASQADKFFPRGLEGVELDEHPLRYEAGDWEPWMIKTGANKGKQAWKHVRTNRVRLTPPGQEEGGQQGAKPPAPDLEPATPLPEGPKGFIGKIKAMLGKFNPSFSLTEKGFERLPPSSRSAADLGIPSDDHIRQRSPDDAARNELNERQDWSNWPDDHINALMIYSGGNYKAINTALRAGVLPGSETNRKVVEWLDDAFAANPDFEKPVTVYKGASFESQVDQKRFLTMLLTAANEGVAVSLGGYQSTTVASETMNHFSRLQSFPVHLEIAAHNGIYMERAAHANFEVQQGKDVNQAISEMKENPELQSYNGLSIEREMLLSRDTRYRVLGFKEVEFIETQGKPPVTKMVVQLEQIPGVRADYGRHGASHYDKSQWTPWIIKSGPRKGQSAWKNLKTGKVQDEPPGESSDPAPQAKQGDLFEHLESEESPEPKSVPGSQMDEDVVTRLKSIGMVGSLPPAAVPIEDIKVADLSQSDDDLRYQALISWTQTTKSGRKSRQYRYTSEFHQRNAESKFARVEAIEPYMEGIQNNLQERMVDTSLPGRDRDAAAIAAVIAETGLRPTDDPTSVEHGHFGIASLRGHHVLVYQGKVYVHFIGKEGVENTTVIEDPVNSEYLREAKERAGSDGELFPSATSTHAISELKEAAKSAGVEDPDAVMLKDLRTVKAATVARQAIGEFTGPPPPWAGEEKKDAKLLAKAILQISSKVSEALNNEPTMARDSYINPRIFREWQQKLSETL